MESLDAHLGDNLSLVCQVIRDNVESIGFDYLVRQNMAQLDSEYIPQVLETVLKVLLKAESLQQKKVRFQKLAKQSIYQEEFALKLSPLEDELNQSTN